MQGQVIINITSPKLNLTVNNKYNILPVCFYINLTLVFLLEDTQAFTKATETALKHPALFMLIMFDDISRIILFAQPPCNVLLLIRAASTLRFISLENRSQLFFYLVQMVYSLLQLKNVVFLNNQWFFPSNVAAEHHTIKSVFNSLYPKDCIKKDLREC